MASTGDRRLTSGRPDQTAQACIRGKYCQARPNCRATTKAPTDLTSSHLSATSNPQESSAKSVQTGSPDRESCAEQSPLQCGRSIDEMEVGSAPPRICDMCAPRQHVTEPVARTASTTANTIQIRRNDRNIPIQKSKAFVHEWLRNTELPDLDKQNQADAVKISEISRDHSPDEGRASVYQDRNAGRLHIPADLQTPPMSVDDDGGNEDAWIENGVDDEWTDDEEEVEFKGGFARGLALAMRRVATERDTNARTGEPGRVWRVPVKEASASRPVLQGIHPPRSSFSHTLNRIKGPVPGEEDQFYVGVSWGLP